MAIRVITRPTVEPVSTEEMKLHLREDLADQDLLINALIVAAREYAEAYTGRAFITQTLELTLDEFPAGGEIEIPNPPLQLVEHVKYIDADGVLQTVNDALYQVDPYAEPGKIKPAYGEVWPDTRAGEYNAVQVRYICGYAEIGSPSGADPANGVPDGIKHWMKVRVAQLYEHREAVIIGTIVAPIPRDFVDGLLDPYRVRRYL